MIEHIAWSTNPAEFKEWEFDDAVSDGPLNDAICSLLNERMKIIFGKHGIRPEIYLRFDLDNGTPQINFSICDDSGADPLAEVDFPLEQILREFIQTALEDSDEAPGTLQLVLEKALSELTKSPPAPK